MDLAVLRCRWVGLQRNKGDHRITIARLPHAAMGQIITDRGAMEGIQEDMDFLVGLPDRRVEEVEMAMSGATIKTGTDIPIDKTRSATRAEVAVMVVRIKGIDLDHRPDDNGASPIGPNRWVDGGMTVLLNRIPGDQT